MTNPSISSLQEFSHLLSEMNLQKMESTESQDVFIVGYPKSGNTWMQNLIAGLVFGCNPSITPDALIQALVPDVHQKRHYRRFSEIAFFKTHHFPQEHYKRVIYIVRDGRDAMVSYYHFTQALSDIAISFEEMVRSNSIFPGRWEDHVEAWLNNPYSVEMIVIKYENLQNDCTSELRKICDFLSLEHPDEYLADLAKQASFENLQAKEKRQGWENQSWPKDKLFNRRGVVGSYKDEMPAEVLHEFFNPKSERLLGELGYLSQLNK